MKTGDALQIIRQQVARQVMAVDRALSAGAGGSFKTEFGAAGVDDGQGKSVYGGPRGGDGAKRAGKAEIADGKDVDPMAIREW
jgi:hypothetical protein